MKYIILLITLFSIESFGKCWAVTDLTSGQPVGIQATRVASNLTNLGSAQLQPGQKCEYIVKKERQIPDTPIRNILSTSIDETHECQTGETLETIYKSELDPDNSPQDLFPKYISVFERIECVNYTPQTKTEVYYAVDIDKKAAAEQTAADNKVIEDAEKLIRDAENVVLKRMDCGRRVLAKLILIDEARTVQLTNGQRRTRRDTHRNAMEALERGLFDEARIYISVLVTDGILIRESDKTALINAIDECNGG